MKNYYIIYLSITFLLAACKKDIDVFIPENPVTTSMVYVKTDLGGKVTDENNTPLSNVAIEISTKNGIVTATTDENGIFLRKNLEVRQDRLYIKALANDYFIGSKTIEVTGNTIESIEIKLIAKEFVGIINSNVGGVVAINDGARVTFAPNSIADNTGAPFSGNVQIAARWLNPASADIFHIMPGNLVGEDSLGREFVMSTAGMIVVELFSENFEELNILSGKTAELRFPIPTSLINLVPDEIPLWSFVENKGVWGLEGVAQLIDNQYIANVSHFSFWNCDALFPIIHGQGKIIDETGNAVANALVKITVGGLNTRSGWTNSEGVFSGKLPANETIEILVCDACGNPLSEVTTLTTSNTDVVIPDITVTQTSAVTNIVGSVVDCDDNPVTNGYVTVTSGTIGQHVFLDDNGTFNNTFLHCNETVLKLFAVDIDAEKTSATDTFNIVPSIDAGIIEVCDELAEFISFDLDGEPYLYANPINVTGNYSPDGVGVFDASQGFSLFSENTDIAVNQTYPVTFMMITGIPSIVEYQVELVLSDLGIPGAEMLGTFSGTFLDEMDVAHTIDGTFKVIRDF